MTAKTRAARHSCNYHRAKKTLPNKGELMIPRADYDRACKYAGIALCAMFALMTIGTVLFGW